jgi:hypothetical protein
MLNNGIGIWAGAALASSFGRRVLEFLAGNSEERRNIYLWMLVLCMIFMVGPLDVNLDYFSRFRPGLSSLAAGGWRTVSATGQDWIHLAGFALIGALAGRLVVPGRRRRSFMRLIYSAALVVLFPLALAFGHLLAQARPPLLHALVLDLAGSLAGFLVGLLWPAAVRATVGLPVMIVALVAAGLSPFAFAGWTGGPVFQWIPFYEYCTRRSPIALYELILTLTSFAILGGLLHLSLVARRRFLIVSFAVLLAVGIEFAQTFLPARTAGITHVLMAGFGAWTGALFCASVQSSRRNNHIV